MRDCLEIAKLGALGFGRAIFTADANSTERHSRNRISTTDGHRYTQIRLFLTQEGSGETEIRKCLFCVCTVNFTQNARFLQIALRSRPSGGPQPS